MISLHIWFMFENHTFEKVKSRDRDGMINEAYALFKEDGCGSLFVKDIDGATLNSLTLHGIRRNGQWGIAIPELEQWADTIMKEISFRKMMIA